MFPKTHTPVRGGRARAAVLLLCGTVAGIFLILFALANDDWIVLSMPNPPWYRDPSWPAFESRLWAVMLASFLLGLVSAGAGVYAFRRGAGIRKGRQKQRIDALERELDKTNRLLAATRKKM